jgi:hypothetical protein
MDKKIDAANKTISALSVLEAMRPKKTEVISSPVKEVVQVEYKGPDDTESKKIKDEVKETEQKFFEKEPVRIFVDYSHTIPMRPYESAKVSVGLSIPVGIEISADLEAKIKSTYDYASKFIGARMEEEIIEIKKYVETLKK